MDKILSQAICQHFKTSVSPQDKNHLNLSKFDISFISQYGFHVCFITTLQTLVVLNACVITLASHTFPSIRKSRLGAFLNHF